MLSSKKQQYIVTIFIVGVFFHYRGCLFIIVGVFSLSWVSFHYRGCFFRIPYTVIFNKCIHINQSVYGYSDLSTFVHFSPIFLDRVVCASVKFHWQVVIEINH